MNHKKIGIAATVSIMMFFSSSALSGAIVDTGEPSPNTTGGAILSTQAYYAAEFSLQENMIVTDINGWLGNSQGSLGYGSGFITIALYDDGGDIPGNEIFSSALFIPPTDQNAWHGLSNLSWALATGEYWVSFEVRANEGQAFNGYMQRTDIPNPLANYATFDNHFLSPNQGQWIDSTFARFAVQIDGYSSTVSEPISTILIITGGVLLIGMRHLSRRKFSA